MLPIDALHSMRPMVATPAYGFGTTVPYTASMFSLATLAGKIGWDLGLEFRGESLIPRSRNVLTAVFLAGDWTHLFFIDADLKFAPEAVIRLLLADRDMAAGIYPLKQLEPVAYPFFPVRPGESDAEGFAEVYPVAGGFTCIRREVVEEMTQAYPELEYLPDVPGDTRRYFDLFPAFIEPESRHYWSEDYGFCYLWHKLGGKVYADVHSKLSHYGQHLYHGDLMEHLRGKEANHVQEAA